MHTGRTSTPEFASRTRSEGWATFTRATIASCIACALATGALAKETESQQKTQPQQKDQQQKDQQQKDQQRLPPQGRLIVPVTGIVGTAETPAPVDTPAVTTSQGDAATTPTSTPATSPGLELPTTLEPPAAPGGALAPTVTGWFSIRKFARTTDGGIAAVGTLILSLADPTSSAPRTIVTQLAMPIEMPGGSPALGGPDTLAQPIDTAAPAPKSVGTQACETVTLTLGPVDLDIRGMAVQLDEVNIDFTRVEGGTQPFGALLCDVTGLIESAARPADLVKTLNTLLETIG